MKKSIHKSKLLTFIYFNLSALFLLLLYSNIQVLAQPNDPPGLENAKSVQEAHTPNLFDNPDVVGTAVGLDDNGEPVIKVFVLTEQFRGIPQSLEGFQVEVEVTGMFVARSDIQVCQLDIQTSQLAPLDAGLQMELMSML